MKADIRNDTVTENEQHEVFAEVSLFDAEMTDSDESGDCGCFSCDGNPCVK
jgi:hypothetical protein